MSILHNRTLRTLALATIASLSFLSSSSCSRRLKPEAAAPAQVRILNRSDIPVFRGVAPIILTLDSQEGLANRRANYTIELTERGSTPLRLAISYFEGNWAWERKNLGGSLQLLAVDCSTGAIYKLDQRYVGVFFETHDSQRDSKPKIDIRTMMSVPDDWRPHLVPVYTPSQADKKPLHPH
ncbi:MAG: hypothetical protein Q4A64_04905 [Porphyromonadaceae bacterium]|nr:hypothetical protein [Porphyromonadaceae bacterium]